MKHCLSRIFTLAILLLILSLAVLPAAAETGSDCGAEGSSVTWNLTDGVLTISGTGSMRDKYHPWYDSYTSNVPIYSVVVQPGITHIGSNAFELLESVTSVSLPEGLVSIGDRGFMQCTNLTSIVFPSTLKRLGCASFCNCSMLTSVTLPDGFEKLGAAAFSTCAHLARITMPSSLSSIGDGALAECPLLFDITFPENCKIGANVVHGSGNASITVKSGDVIGDQAFYYTTLKEITLEEGVKYIGNYAFSYSSIDSIVLPQSLRFIGNKAFRVSKLQNITIPKNVAFIGELAFNYCDNLTDINVDPENSCYSSLDGVLFDKSMQTLICHPEKNAASVYAVPNSVTKIEKNAFQLSSMLTKVVLNSGLEKIAECGFYECKNMDIDSFPEGLVSIGSYAFWSDTALTKAILPDSLTDLRHGAFSCSGISSVFIPPNLIELPDIVFSDCYSLTKVDIPDSVVSIGDGAFTRCSSLSDVRLPKAVKYLGNGAFSGTAITQIDLPDNLVQLPSGLFASTPLNSISIPKTVTVIHSGAFSRTALTTVDLPKRLTRLESGVFLCCSSLAEITIPSDVEFIADDCFSGCTSLHSATFLGNAPSDFGKFENLIDPTQVENSPMPPDPASVFYLTAKDFTIYYAENAAGWTSPTWNGYPAVSIPVDSLSLPAFLKAPALVFLSPDSGSACDQGLSQLRMKFDRPITAGSGKLTIWNALTGKPVFSADASAMKPDGQSINIDISSVHFIAGQTYYVTADNGLVYSEDGFPFLGILLSGIWRFQIRKNPTLSQSVSYQWIRDWFGTGRCNQSIPPIPAGNRNQYAHELSNWENQYHASDLVNETDYNDLIKMSMKFPAVDQHGSSLLLDTGTATVEDVVRDILFIQTIQPYMSSLRQQMGNVLLDDGSLENEKPLFSEALSWYGQISAFMQQSNSNFYLTSYAPKSVSRYIGLNQNYSLVGPDFQYVYTVPMLSAQLQSSSNAQSVFDSISSSGTVSKYNQLVSDALQSYADGNVEFAAICDGRYPMTISGNLMNSVFQGAKSDVASSLCKAFSSDSEDSVWQSGVLLSVSGIRNFLGQLSVNGSGLSLLPYETKTAYFIGYAYVARAYPSAFSHMIGGNGLLLCGAALKSILGQWNIDPDSTSDPLFHNWLQYLLQQDLPALPADIFVIRDLQSYAMLLNYIDEYEADSSKGFLLNYLRAELRQAGQTTVFASCPVAVSVLDENGVPISTLSSQNADSITNTNICSAYLMGTADETKCFVLSAQNCSLQIDPYAEGTMDLRLTEQCSGNYVSQASYNAVPVTPSVTLISDTDVTGNTLRTSSHESRDPNNAIEISGIEISGAQKMEVGDTVALLAAVKPVDSSAHVTWSSSDESLAVVSESGVVTALSAGTVCITASVNGLSASVNLTIALVCRSLTAAVSSVSMMTGEAWKPVITAQPAVAADELIWESSNPDIAIVKDGIIYGEHDGVAVITCKAGSASCLITVSVFSTPLSIRVEPGSVSSDRISVSLYNNSCCDIFDKNLLIGIYEGGRCLQVLSMDPVLDPGAAAANTLPLQKAPGSVPYTIRVYALDSGFCPIQLPVQTAVAGARP